MNFFIFKNYFSIFILNYIHYFINYYIYFKKINFNQLTKYLQLFLIIETRY